MSDHHDPYSWLCREVEMAEADLDKPRANRRHAEIAAAVIRFMREDLQYVQKFAGDTAMEDLRDAIDWMIKR